MSLSAAQLLTVSAALVTKCEAADNIDTVFPTATGFGDKADYWAFVAAKTTQVLLETTLVRAAWISYLTFEDIGGSEDSPVKQITYELTLFHENDFARLDETAVPDAFNARVQNADHEHDTAIFSLQTQFQGRTSLGLDVGTFTVGDVTSLVQDDSTERHVPVLFIADDKVLGSMTRFLLEVELQLIAC